MTITIRILLNTIMINQSYITKLFMKMLDMNNLYTSFILCKKCVDWKYSIQKFESNLLYNLYTIRHELMYGTYKQRQFYEFDLCERGKHRHIKALNIRDRVIQRCLCDNILMPEISKHIIYDNGASVKGKGIDFARSRLQKHLRRYFINEKTNQGYVLKIDFSNYFGSIDHEIAISQISKIINDKSVIDLMRYMISTFGTGLGIGSQLSQALGLYYLTPLDKYCTIVKGCRYYERYMDDICIIHKSKLFIKKLLTEIYDIANNLKLTINKKKTQICKICNRFTFLKIKYFLTNTGKVIMIPDKSIVKREKRKLKKFKIDNVCQTDVLNQYKSVRNMLNKYNGFNITKRLDKYYFKLFKEENQYGYTGF